MKSREAICAALAQDLMDLFGSIIQAQTVPAPDSKLYTYSDLAEMLSKATCTIRRWVCAGEFGEPVKVGNSTRVTQAGLDKFIADHSGPTKKMPSRARKCAARTAVNPQGQPLGI